MPKQGFESVTIPKELDERILDFINSNKGILNSKTQAIAQAWQVFESIHSKEKHPRPVLIGNKLVGHDQPVFITAEIGINHNGDLNICKKLIDMASKAGCDAVKLQKRTIEQVYSKEELAKPRESIFGKTNGDLKRGLEFGYEEYKEIDKYCKERGILWFASTWDKESVDFLEKFNVPCHKIPSAMLTNRGLLLKIKSTKKPIILSTGMSTMEQILKAAKLLEEKNLIIMHCTSTYPTAENEHDLNVIKLFRRIFNCPIGYSGHEPGVYPTLIAAAFGACMLERHITLDRAMFGSDQSASLEKKGIEIICEVARLLPMYMGNDKKRVYDSEIPIIKKLRKIETL